MVQASRNTALRSAAPEQPEVCWYLVPEEGREGCWRMTTLRPAHGVYQVIRNGTVEPGRS